MTINLAYIFYTDEDLTEKTAQPMTCDLPDTYYELLAYDIGTLKSTYGLTIYDIEWTRDDGVSTDLTTAKNTNDALIISDEIDDAWNLCLEYQELSIDANFMSVCISNYKAFIKTGTIESDDCPYCVANVEWLSVLWDTVWVDVKASINAEEDYSTDFSALMVAEGSTSTAPSSFSNCYSELYD